MIISTNTSPVTPSNRHWKTKEKVLDLRKEGLSLNEISARIPTISKSTISLWCRDIKLTNDQRNRLNNKRDYMSGIRAIQNKFWNLRCDSFNNGLKKFSQFKKDEIFIAGLMLYWAEGTKSQNAAVSNSDARIMGFMSTWFKKYFKLSRENFSIHLHLHSGQNENKMKRYWSKITDVPLQNFEKSFIKEEGSGYRKNILYNGTIKMRVAGKGSTYMLFEIFGCLAGFLEKITSKKPNIEDWIPKLPHAD